MLWKLYKAVSGTGKTGGLLVIIASSCPASSCLSLDAVCLQTGTALAGFIALCHNSCLECAVMCAGAQKRSFLLVLDASNMQEIARAWTQHPVTLGFHGNFFDLDAFKAAA